MGNPDFRVRFNYQSAAWGWWFAVDDVEITAEVDDACVTGESQDPAPAPDGSSTTDSLRGERITSYGSVIAVTRDTTSCPATGYNLIHGDLANVADYVLDGAECWLGTSGTHVWSRVRERPAAEPVATACRFPVVGDQSIAWPARSSRMTG